MEIRKIEQREHGRTRSLYETVFAEDSKRFVDYYYEVKTKDNTIYVVEDEEEICAMIHLNPYVIMANGKEIPAHYIVAVATKPECRRRGYMGSLLKASLNGMYKENEPFTFLMPASENIYIPYDFRTVYDQDQRYYRESQHVEKGTVVRKAKPEDAGAVAKLANSFLVHHFQLYAKRDAVYYKRLMREYESDEGCLMITEKEGRITDCQPYVPEEVGEKPKIMIRIVDLKRMLMLLELTCLTAVCFHVTDPLICENNRCLLVTGSEFSGVMLMEGKPENSEGTITIAALASLIFGKKTAAQIREEAGVRMTDRMQAELEKIVPVNKIFLNEIV